MACFITGSMSGPERVSPPVVFLTPPEKLVVEVRASGNYDFINWIRNGLTLSLSASTELINFYEIFVRQPTTTSEYGTYEAIYTGNSLGSGAEILVVPTGMLL